MTSTIATRAVYIHANSMLSGYSQKTTTLNIDDVSDSDTEDEYKSAEEGEYDSEKRTEKTTSEGILPTVARTEVVYNEHPFLRYVQDNVIGHDLVVDGPYGPRKGIYCDYTASGRSVAFIEDYIRTYVCPYYGNTHTTTSINSRQTSFFRNEARNIIRQSVNATHDDVVIFTGSGTTAGIHKLAWALNLNQKEFARDTAVLIGPYEHHSNILPWKESGATISRIRQTKHGQVDLEHLELELQVWSAKKSTVIVAMSAASNVSGIVTDTEAVSKLTHLYGGLSVWDYAAAGAYMKIDMNSSPTAYKDAVILSPHKFVGGPGTPGIMIAKRWMFRNAVPDHCGGGTVLFVTRDTHIYLKDIETREEGGTPAIIESIRAGMVFKLKEAVGTSLIESREDDLRRKALAIWKDNPNLYILGSQSVRRLPIFSFLVQHKESGKLLHHNFVSALLSDLYGIQARGGCACAGPYAEDLLGISESVAQNFIWFLQERTKHSNGETCPVVSLEIMKPGFTRINLPFFYDDETIDYIVQAIHTVAHHGWKLLPFYTFDPYTGSWTHRKLAKDSQPKLFSLHDMQFTPRGMINTNQRPPSMDVELDMDSIMEEADNILETAEEEIEAQHFELADNLDCLIPEDMNHFRWFLTPSEAARCLSDGVLHDLVSVKRTRLPFRLRRQFSSGSGSDTDSNF